MKLSRSGLMKLNTLWMALSVMSYLVSDVAADPHLSLVTIGPAAQDSGSYLGGVSAVEFRGTGSGVQDSLDNVLFCFGNTSGDFDVDAFCSVISDTVGTSENGIMVRSDTTSDAMCIALLIRTGQGVFLKYRTINGGTVRTVLLSSDVNNYLRIRKIGNLFDLFCRSSPDSVWKQLGTSYALSFPSLLCVGVYHSSGNEVLVTGCVFSSINGLPEGGQTGGSACEPVVWDFDSTTSLSGDGFRDIDNWVLDTAGYIRSEFSPMVVDSAHIVTPSFEMPLGTDTVSAGWSFYFKGDTTPYLYNYGLFSQERLTLNDRVNVTADLVGSGEKIITGIDDTIHCSLNASDSAILKDRTRVYGDVTTGKECLLINNAQVFGTIAEYTLPEIPVLDTESLSPGAVSLTVAAYDSLNCLPGNYDTLRVFANAKVRFGQGVYTFSRLLCSPEVRLYMDVDIDNFIALKVIDSLQLGDRCRMVVTDSSAARNISVYSHQTGLCTFGSDLQLKGYFLIPRAEAHLISRGTVINGGLYARKISFEPDFALTVTAPSIKNNLLTTTLTSTEAGGSPYSLEVITHQADVQDTMTDIFLKRDTVTVASLQTGASTPLNRWQSIVLQIFNGGEQNQLRMLYDNGIGTVMGFDSIPFGNDTLSALVFDYHRNGLIRPLVARIDSITLSCVADSCSALYILSQPVNDTVYEGGTAVFGCSAAAGSSVAGYQWYRDSIAVVWATNPSLTLSNVSTLTENGARFYCLITGPCEQTISTNEVVLKVDSCSEPVIYGQPQDTSVLLSGTAQFHVSTTGIGLAYTWRRNDDTIPGAHDADLIVSSVKAFNNQDRYRVTITNGCGKTVQSDEALLVVRDVGPCRITGQPQNDTLPVGDFYRTSISTVCEEGQLQWYRNSSPLTGDTSADLLYGPVSDGDNGSEFRCVVYNGTTVDTSLSAYLTVYSPDAKGASIAVSGELFDGDGDTVGTDGPVQLDFLVKLYARKLGGVPVYTEEFKGNHSVYVLQGEFTVTLGQGIRDHDLQKVTAAHNDLYAEIAAGRNGGYEIIAPRLHLTAAPYAFRAGVKVIYGEGNPETGGMNAPLGTVYIDRSDGDSAWKLAAHGWVKLD